MPPPTTTQDAIDRLASLVAFDTTSRNSNMSLIDWVDDLLKGLGARTEKIATPDGAKANLWATLGPDIAGGVVLSGHTDVVPVDGQPWSTDPWTLTEKNGKLYGRGTCDMKGFVACALAAAPRMAAMDLKRPIHFAFSHDEEVGCKGVPALIERVVATKPMPSAVIIGEPTDMNVVSGHKSMASFICEVEGREAHSSQLDKGVSAVMEALRIMRVVQDMSDEARSRWDPSSPFDPPGTTITIGVVEGGTAVNILARRCSFVWDLRCVPGDDPDAYVARFAAACAEVDASIKARAPEGGVRWTERSRNPALAIVPDSEAERLARSITGDNAERVVAYMTEGGLFQEAGMSTVVIGPGSIQQAHQPDEYVAIDQLAACVRFLDRLADRMTA